MASTFLRSVESPKALLSAFFTLKNPIARSSPAMTMPLKNPPASGASAPSTLANSLPKVVTRTFRPAPDMLPSSSSPMRDESPLRSGSMFTSEVSPPRFLLSVTSCSSKPRSLRALRSPNFFLVARASASAPASSGTRPSRRARRASFMPTFIELDISEAMSSNFSPEPISSCGLI